ncbi:methyltransferase domain-containing protein [Bradyrhizobium sp. Pear76]|uniref:class I SAM-dependent methyltransferase n=1 Tax=Bradyrhizobium oropedii TaxID=1571201 RepID=UPI001E33C977|nr:methyltransferase domain-containing protein [Bradyrhizobium oropedii]MCC8968722.1 methyltransferase domain-containing protein [Bradyrhizobium oropedii]
MKQLLRFPALYQAYQNVGGFFGARVKSIAEYLPLKAGDRVIDIGCGPGYIVEHLPRGITYIGFDIDQAYIYHARRKFSDRGTFQCRLFDEAVALEFAGADCVTMMGVMHHIADDSLKELLRSIRTVLRPGGTLFVLEPCYRSGQRAFAKWMLDNDRGDFVRSEEGYRAILSDAFEKVRMIIREDYARVPCTFVVGLATNAGD